MLRVTKLTIKDTFIQAGCTIHSAAVDQLTLAHNKIEMRIRDYHESSAGILEAHDRLYSNIEWPLSRTQCSSETHPKATVSSHLQTLTMEFRSAEDKLKALARE